MTTERKRPSLDLSGFSPKPTTPEPIATKDIVAISKEAGFRSDSVAAEVSSKPASAPAAKPKPTKYVRIAFDVPEKLRQALQDGSRKHGLGTVRAVILDALKAKGYPVSEDELLDKRTRR